MLLVLDRVIEMTVIVISVTSTSRVVVAYMMRVNMKFEHKLYHNIRTLRGGLVGSTNKMNK